MQNFIERHARLVSDAHAWIHFGAALFINDRKVGEGPIPRTMPIVNSTGEGLTAGRDPATP